MTKLTVSDVEVLGLVAVGAGALYLLYKAGSTVGGLFSQSTETPAVSDPNHITDASPSWKKEGQGGSQYPGTVQPDGSIAGYPGVQVQRQPTSSTDNPNGFWDTLVAPGNGPLLQGGVNPATLAVDMNGETNYK